MIKPSQRSAVLQHLLEHGTITSWEAIKEYGATRLSAIIYDLRDMGYDIGGDMVESTNRFGNPVRFKRYKLLAKPQPKQTLLTRLLKAVKTKEK